MDSSSRYLLSGGGDATVALFDLDPSSQNSIQSPLPFPTSTTPKTPLQIYEDKIKWSRTSRKRKPLQHARRANAQSQTTQHMLPTGHRFSLSAVNWYPPDNGMFLTGDRGGNVLLWDTNSFKPVLHYPLLTSPGVPSYSITSLAFPPTPTTTFVATTTTGVVYQFDMLSPPNPTLTVPAATKAGSTSATFHPHNEHLLITTGGAGDGTIKLWDLRRSGTSSFVTSCQASNVISRTTTSPNQAHPSTQYAPSDTRHFATASLLPASETGVSNARWCASGQFLVSLACSTGELAVWDFRGVIGNDSTNDDSTSGLINPSSYGGSGVVSEQADWGKPVLREVEFPPLNEMATGADEKTGQSGKWKIDLEVFDAVGKGRLGDQVFVSPIKANSADVFVGSVWGGAGGKVTKLSGHLSGVKSLALCGDGGECVTGSSDGMLLAWGYNGESKPKAGGENGDVDNW